MISLIGDRADVVVAGVEVIRQTQRTEFPSSRRETGDLSANINRRPLGRSQQWITAEAHGKIASRNPPPRPGGFFGGKGHVTDVIILGQELRASSRAISGREGR